MSRVLRTALAGLTIAVALAVPTFAQEGDETVPLPEPTAEQASIDAKALHALYDKHHEKFEGIWGGISVSETSIEGTLRLCEEHMAKIEMLEADVLPEIEPVLARVTELWGPKPDEEEGENSTEEDAEPVDPADLAFQQAGDIEWNMKMAAANNDIVAARDLPEEFDRLSTCYSDLVRMLHDVRKTRVANAEYLCNFVQNIFSPEDIADTPVDVRMERLDQAKQFLTYAVKFDKSHPYANDRLASIDGEIAAQKQAIEAEIDNGKWAGNADGAPGLASDALSFLRNHPNWGRNENGTQVLNVCVRGGWVPGERDIFGRILNWGLPIHVAVTTPKWSGQNRARVYQLTVLTQGYGKTPPFTQYWVGDSWYIRPNALP